jgi:4-amino-4-deoxy-L-arabinose transferase-like glycosyltransferase
MMADIAVPAPRLEPAHVRTGLAANLRLTFDRLSIAGLTLLSGLFYLVNLTVSGYGNTYYAAGAQAASQSWSALSFGAIDSSGFITIDKPPLATALMGLSVKLLGLSHFSVLLPQALLGIGTVLILFLAVRRSFGSRAALIAGVIMAVTPVAVLIFRYDNPDALLTFLLVCAAWALGRGIEDGRIRWAVAAGTLIGLAFLTKYLQAYLVLPAFALTWLVSAPGTVRRRIAGLGAAALAVAASSLWWVAIVELLPAGSRPYIGGSTTNSPLELLLGYDGLGRLFGNRPNGSGLGSGLDGFLSVGNGGPAGASFSGEPGLFRMLNAQFGGEIGWLLPAAILSLVAALVIHRRTARSNRTDRRVAGSFLWGTWLLVHVLVFSFMSGIIHTYYAVAVAPAIAALVGAAAVDLWDRRSSSRFAAVVLATGVVVTGVTAWGLLERTSSFVPGLGIGLLALSIAAAIVIVIPADAVRPAVDRAAVVLVLVATPAGPLSYAVETAQTGHDGGDPHAGPTAQGVRFGDGGPPGLSTVTADALARYLDEHRGDTRWLVAVDGADQAASIQLVTNEPVMAMGGFSGNDPAPTLGQLEAYIHSGELRYVVVGGRGGPDGGGFGPGIAPRGSNVTAERTQWVLQSCQAVSVAGATGLYDCAGAAG